MVNNESSHAILLVGIVLTLCCPILCAPVLGFEGWLAENESIVVNDETFTVYQGSANVAILDSDNPDTGRVYVSLNRSLEKNNFFFYYDGMKSNWSDYYAKYNLTGIKGVEEENVFHVRIEELKPSLTVTTELSSDKVNFKEYFNKTIILHNSGTQNIDSLYYKESIPIAFRKEKKVVYSLKKEDDADFGVERTSSTDPLSGAIIWQGSLEPGEKVRIIATLAIFGKQDYNSEYQLNRGSATYFFNGAEIEARESAKQSVELIQPLILECYYDKEDQHVGEMNTLYVQVNNTHEMNSVDIHNITVGTDDDFGYDLSNSDFDNYYGNIYYRGKVLDSGEGVRLKLPIDLTFAKNYTARPRVDYEYLGMDFALETSCMITPSIGRVRAELDLNQSPSFNSTERRNLTLLVMNEANSDEFRNIKVNITSTLINDLKYVFLLLERSANARQQFEFIAPLTNVDLDQNLTLSYTYDSVFGQRFYRSSTASVHIFKKPFNATIRIGYSLKQRILNLSNGTVILIDPQNMVFRVNLEKIEDIHYDEMTVHITEEANGLTDITYTLDEDELIKFNEDSEIQLDFNMTEEEANSSDDMMIKLEYTVAEEKIVFAQQVNSTMLRNDTTEPDGPIDPADDNGPAANETAAANNTSIANSTDIADDPDDANRDGAANATVIAPENSTLIEDVTEVQEKKTDEDEAIAQLFAGKKKKSSTFSFKDLTEGAMGLALGLVVVIVVFLFIVIIGMKTMKKARKKKKEKASVMQVKPTDDKQHSIKVHKDGSIVVFEVPNPSFNYDELNHFLEVARKERIPETRIRQMLLDKGWLPDLLDVFISHHSGTAQAAGRDDSQEAKGR